MAPIPARDPLTGVHRRALPWRDDLGRSLHRADPRRYPFLLESAATGTPQGRFDILFAPGESPDVLEAPASGDGGDFLGALDRWWRREAVPPPAPGTSSLPFTGGWFLYLGYELAGQVEPTLALRPPRSGPVAMAVRVPAAVVLDRQAREAWLVAEDEAHAGPILDDIDVLPDAGAERSEWLLEGALREEPPGIYLDAIEAAKYYIHEGDIFQANLSREWQGRLRPGCTPADIFARLRRSNPGPFAALMQWGEWAVVSSSPERLLSLRDGMAETRPIAGTRPRGSDALGDARQSRELHAHPKERAEHVMLIDLERNDLGRVCRFGSVEVDELMVIETYAHVHHIVSNVRGRLRKGVGPGEAIRAVFPGGTITGCPKVRCMEIISELEAGPRGAYTGSLGYLNRDGSLDLNILIRTLQVDGRDVSFRAGGGIVADSVPDAELEETRAKARGLVLALSDGATP